MSSVNRLLLQFIKLGRSFIYARGNVGPRTDLREAPVATDSSEEICPSSIALFSPQQ